VVGKPLGIVAAAWFVCRVGAGRLPDRVGWGQLTGAAALAGIPFTVSLLVVPLALPAAVQDEARVGVLAAMVLSGAAGAALMASASRRVGTNASGGSVDRI